MNSNQEIRIERDANGNVFVSGNSNIVIVQASHISELSQPKVVPEIGRNPYKGLLTFLEEDMHRFFGRETLVQDIWQRFRAFYASALHPSPLRVLAILGPSGSGKSSVIRAGFIPELARKPLPEMQKKARVAVLQPGEHPLRVLAAVLARIATNDPSPAAKTREFADELALKNAGGAYDGLSRIAEVLPDIQHSPLIVLVDQCEELYTACQDSGQCQAFIGNLLYAAAARTPYVSVILTLRSDFLGHTQSHPALNHAIAANGIIVPVMNDAELHDAIAKPAEQAGHPLKEGTIRLLIEQTEGREGALPLLQFALERIWDGMAGGIEPAETLKQIGGVGGALAHKAQELYDGLDETEKLIARRAFLGMIQLGEGTQDTRRRVLVSNIVAQGEAPQHVHAVLQWFSQQTARLITLSAEQDRGNVAEVTHEALITHWETLQEWLKSSRDDLRFHRRLAEAAKHWETNARPEGLLWRPPDLELLEDFQARLGHDMTALENEFRVASVTRQEREQAEKEAQRRKELEAQRKIAEEAKARQEAETRARQAAERRSFISAAQSLVAYALQKNAENDREYAALLARQAYFLNQRYKRKEEEHVTGLIDDSLRTILHPLETDSGPLVEQVCQKVKYKLSLTQEEWETAVGKNFPHQPHACFEENEPEGTARIHLRHNPILTTDGLALSLNLYKEGDYWYPKRYVEYKVSNDRFEKREKVILDRATGLMWQNADLPGKELTYGDAEAYVRTLNDKKFAGYNDWRLPTIPELSSLLEKEKQQENDLYLDPLFEVGKKVYYWVWSGDKRQRKGEGSSSSAWYVGFNDGGGVDWDYFDTQSGVRCVRF